MLQIFASAFTTAAGQDHRLTSNATRAPEDYRPTARAGFRSTPAEPRDAK